MKKRILAGVVLLFAVAAGGLYLTNHLRLQVPMDEVVKGDPRNDGIQVSVRYSNYWDASQIIVDVESVDPGKSAADVFRVLLQLADRLESRDFAKVALASKGKVKFLLDGAYFARLGAEYGTQNPVYTMRSFPENLRKPDGSPAFSTWSGGLLGVVGKQMEDFTEFHRKWYMEDMR